MISKFSVIDRLLYAGGVLWVDNVTLNSGTGGATAATDDIGGVHYQRVKISVGADGTANDAVPVSNGLDSTATGILAVGPVGQYDDVAVGTVTENQFAPLRITSARRLMTSADVVSSALPTGAGTSAKQDTIIGHLDGVEGLLTTINSNTGTLAVVGGGVEAAALRVTIASDSTGVLSIDDNGGSLTVDGTVAVTGVSTLAEQQTQTTSLQKIDNIAHSGGDVVLVEHVPISGQFDDTATGTVTEDRIAPVRISSRRALLVEGVASGTAVTVSGTVTANLAAGTNNIGDVDVLTVNGVAPAFGTGVRGATVQRVTIATDDVVPASQSGTWTVQPGNTANTTAWLVDARGPAAHGAAISGNPVRLGGRALTSDYTALTAGQTADLITTLLGKLVTIDYANPANTWSYAAASGGITNTTGVTAKAAAGVGIRNYITRVQVINGHATVSTDVQIRDGAAGTVLWRGFAQAAGGGCSAVFDPPLRGTANTLVEIANGTTGSATYFNLQGFTAAE